MIDTYQETFKIDDDCMEKLIILIFNSEWYIRETING